MIRDGCTIIVRVWHLSDRPSRTDASIQGCVPHAFYNRLSQGVDFLWIIGSKGCGDGWPVIHPALKFELTNRFVTVWLHTTLCHLVSSNIWFVQIMHKVDCKLDKEVALRLIVVRIV